MGSVEILLYCYKAICVAFLLELNYYVFPNRRLFLLLNHRGCAFFLCLLNESLIWKLLHSHATFWVDLGTQFLLSLPNWINSLRKSSTCLTLVIELLYNTLSKENSEQQQLNYVLMFQRAGSSQRENEETKHCKINGHWYQEGKKEDFIRDPTKFKKEMMTQTWLKLFPLWVTSNLVNKERKGYSRWRYKGVDKVSWVFLEKDVSLRIGWYWHKEPSARQESPAQSSNCLDLDLSDRDGTSSAF